MKYFASALAFCFALSVSLFLFGGEATCSKFANPQAFSASLKENHATPLQIRLREFLQRDYETGIEYSKSLQAYGRSGNDRASLHGHAKATEELVEKMESAYYADLPPDFQEAWIKHKHAWKLRKLDLESHISKIDRRVPGYAHRSEINSTYFEMLSISRKHGVDF